MHILLVDDETEFLELMTKRLDRRNFQVTTASTGEAALEALARTPVDVVVLDVRMPGMGGIETLRRLKEMAPDTEVILLTGHANMEVAVEGMELGAFDYLLKPVAINDLIFKIQDAAKKSGKLT
ncbi:MAG TPA: response regulator [Desulfovibrio sp.]|uniref:response regulator n=1 Tax=Desulfovibrio TaxID=872 RepID=UPI002A499BBC|nr:response regulator [Desulfovibrio sp.]MDY0305686.1 response regulator [Desulfovibrionaceae bacterium]HMM40053.1 response regulator [Desulfovibrio sp.]